MLYSYYRISDKPALKIKSKPSFITNDNCLRNFLSCFGQENYHLVADSVGTETQQMIQSCSQQYGFTFETVTYGSGSQSFLHVFEIAQRHNDDDIIYFIEDDFIHLPGSRRILLQAFSETNADYVTLYDHPDKYINRNNGGPNPYIRKGGERTRVIRTTSTHWKETNSTVMTFAARVRTLREDQKVWRRCASGNLPRSFKAFRRLCKQRPFLGLLPPKRMLIHPIPGWATHGETRFLGPYVDWESLRFDIFSPVDRA